MKRREPAGESPLHAYIEGARSRLLTLEGAGEGTWREVVETGLGEAYATADLGGLARVVQFLVNLLEAQERYDDGIREIDAALALVGAEPGPQASLRALKAAMVGGRGEVALARELADAAAEVAFEHLDGDARAKTRSLVESVRFVTLSGPSAGSEGLYRDLIAGRRPLDHLFVLSWEIAFRAATGRPEAARPVIRTFKSISRRRNATFRVIDAAVFARWLAIATGSALALDDEVSTRGNPLANWRMACLDFWQALAHRNWPAAELSLAAMDRRRGRPGSDTGPIEPWEKLFVAASATGNVGHLTPPPPGRLILNNLASALAGAYATALAGSKESAAEWLLWVMKARRAGIESSLELPLSLERVEGLLALRVGKTALARRHLIHAANDPEQAGRVVEAAIAALQVEELRAKVRPETDLALVAARKRVADLGFDPMPHMYTIHQAWDTAAARTGAPPLTPREHDVLRRMAEGETYKETAATLGIAWTTVQTLSHRIYEKLSVSNRVSAIAEGRRLGLL